MSTKKTKKLIKANVEKLRSYDQAYFNGPVPLTTDAVYDALRAETLMLCKKLHKETGDKIHKYFRKSVVGAAPVVSSVAGRRTAVLPVSIGSLDKINTGTQCLTDAAKFSHRIEAISLLASERCSRAKVSPKFSKHKDYFEQRELLYRKAAHYVRSPKADGLSVLLEYTNGKYSLGFSRGDGTMGQDKTEHLATLVGTEIPDTIKKTTDMLYNVPATMYVRGELVMNLFEFFKHWSKNDKRPDGYENPRAAMNGWLNGDKPLANITGVHFVAYDVWEQVGGVPRSLGLTYFPDFGGEGQNYHAVCKTTQLGWLSRAGFRTYTSTALYSLFSGSINADDVTVLHNAMTAQKRFLELGAQGSKKDMNEVARTSHIADFPYLIDGLVYESSDLRIRYLAEQDNSSMCPKFAFALKVGAAEDTDNAESTITDIDWNTSKSGALKPTLRYTPVRLGGSELSAATGNNAAYVSEKGLGIGARVKVVKAGGVIPQVFPVKPVAPDYKKVVCKCGTHAVAVDKALDLYCPNTACQYRARANFIYALKAMNIRGVGEGAFDKLSELSVYSILDLVHYINTSKEAGSTNKARFLALSGVGESLWTKLDETVSIIAKLPRATRMIISGLFVRPGLALAEATCNSICNAIGDKTKLGKKDRELMNQLEASIGNERMMLFSYHFETFVKFEAELTGWNK